MALRDHVVLVVNGQRREVRGGDCFLNLADYLRYRLGLVGTKVVCSEGDCGSCTVLVGRVRGDSLSYQPLDSCIRFLFQLDGRHVVTVEGLTFDGELTPVQQAMVHCHGSQCGFCTPGFVMAMTALCEEQSQQPFDEQAWRQGLTGNLCRCTGYTPILEAGRKAVEGHSSRLNELYPAEPLVRKLGRLSAETLDLRAQSLAGERRAYCPATLEEALAFRATHPTAKVVAGATDVGVQWNKRTIEPSLLLDLNRITELEGVTVAENGDGRCLLAGARATWTELLEVCQSEIPEFAGIVSVFGSPQIRHIGTIGGNLINASPIADSLPFLFVMDAELELASSAGVRRVSINRVFQGY
jgi:xanthine dehydrogenase small subunit